jgi:hypothetical protein
MLSANGQVKKIDSLWLALENDKNADTTRLNVLKDLSLHYMDAKPDSTLVFVEEGYELALKFNRFKDQAFFFTITGNAYANLANYARCLHYYYSAKNVYRHIKDVPDEVATYNNISIAYDKEKEYSKALSFSQLGLKILDKYKSEHPILSSHDKQIEIVLYLNIGDQYLHLNKLDSADYYTKLSFKTWEKNRVQGHALGSILADFGEIEKAKGNKEAALIYFRRTIPLSIADENMDALSDIYLSIAELYHQYKQQDSAEYYGNKALQVGQEHKLLQNVLNASQALYAYFEEDHNFPMAYKYLKLSTVTNDSLFSQKKMRQLVAIDFDEKQRQRDIANIKEKERDNMRAYFLIFGMVTLMLMAFLFWREGRQRAKTNMQLQKQQHRLDAINQNLESMIYERTKDLQDKNEKLFQYSYYLSHQIRGPISTIQGLVNIQKEGLVEQEDFVKMISVCVSDIDNKILEINSILHEQVK